MTAADDCALLRAIQEAAHTVGTSLDWVDHGGGQRAWKLIGEQPGLAREAHAELSPEARQLLPEELLEQFGRAPEHNWWRLEEAVEAARSKLFGEQR